MSISKMFSIHLNAIRTMYENFLMIRPKKTTVATMTGRSHHYSTILGRMVS